MYIKPLCHDSNLIWTHLLHNTTLSIALALTSSKKEKILQQWIIRARAVLVV